MVQSISSYLDTDRASTAINPCQVTMVARLAAPPPFLCTEFSTLLGSAAVAAIGGLYGIQVIGAK